MNETKCASCGMTDGEIFDDKVVRLSEVQIAPLKRPPYKTPPGWGHIALCNVCLGAMRFDLDSFNKGIDEQTEEKTFDTVFYHFVLQFVMGAWNGSTAPTYAELSYIMNSAGMRSEQGKKWTYGNIRQKCEKLQCVPRDLFVDHGPAPAPQESTDAVLKVAAVVAAHPRFGPELIAPEYLDGLPGVPAPVADMDEDRGLMDEPDYDLTSQFGPQ